MRYASIVEPLAGLGSDKWAVHYQAMARKNAGEDVIVASIGEPDFAPPAVAVDATVAALRGGRTHYSTGRGEADVLAAIAERYRASTGRAITADHVIFMPGTQAALFAIMQAVAEAGDEVIVPEPFYVTYDGVIAASGAQMVTTPCDPAAGFHLSADDVERAVTGRSRALLVNSPNNPTGAVLSAGEIGAIGEVCAAHDLWIIADEVYEALVFADDAFASPLADERLAKRTLVASSLSKSHAMTGFRAGWIVAEPDVCDKVLPVCEAMLFGCQPFIEDGAVAALKSAGPIERTMRDAYFARARTVAEGLAGVGGLRCAMPEGGMFMFIDVRELSASGEAFALGLLDEQGLSVLPGEVFGASGAGHVRLSLTLSDADIASAVERLTAYAGALCGRAQGVERPVA